MIKVGVTGGIGTGKSTFCQVWEQLGAFVVYADDFAKHLMITDSELIARIKSVFGDKSYFESGELNRSYLAEEAFKKGRVEELNAIVHPLFWSRLSELENQKEQEGVKIFVKEAAILLQNGRPDDLDLVVILTADESTRVQRVIERDNTTEDSVQGRILKQQDFAEISHLADFIVVNNSSLEDLSAKAKELFYIISSQY